MQPLYKIKRAILETTTITPEQIAVNKSQKKVYMVEGVNLVFVAEMISRSNIVWAEQVQQVMKDRYASLMQ